jgi:hypothetical protein
MPFDWDNEDERDRSAFDQVWNDNAEINWDQWAAHGFDDTEMRDRHLDFVEGLMGWDHMDHAEQLQAWVDYIDGFVNGDLDRDTFFADMGYDPDDFDWDGWRAIMGYDL